MKNNLAIHDLHGEQDLLPQYDLAFFSLGYETRCTAAALYLSNIRKLDISKCFIFSFEENDLSFINKRKNYDNLFPKCVYKYLSPDEDQDIYQILQEGTKELDKVSILIDYSSMSRIWYTAIINWAIVFSENKEISIDFIYTLGDYKTNDNSMVIQGISAIPGCEGSSPRQSESVAIFGLGFHGYTALCVLDQLEPDIIYALLACPAEDDAYVKMSYENNSDLLSKAQKQIKLPLNSVENIYRYFSMAGQF